MKKIILILMFIAILITPLFAQENIDPEKKYIVTGEQLIRWQWQLTSLQQSVHELTNALTEKEIEIVILKSEVEEWKYKYEQSRKGLWIGVGGGYPLGSQGMILYQFNERIGIFMIGGYNSIWSVNLGFIARVK